jgi:aspartate-semialdehyde dehydrogenase
MSEKIPVALLGATGMVGQRFLELLDDHPYFELAAGCASDASCGQTLGDRLGLTEMNLCQAYRDMVLTIPDPQELANKGIKIAFSALPADRAGAIETELANKGIYVFSNARSHRYSPHVPVLIPEINLDQLEAVKDQSTPGFIITNSNCAVVGLAMALKPIYENFGLKEVVVSTFQALSGAGYPGVPSTDILGNVIPHIGGGEEEKVEKEAKKILGNYEDQDFQEASFDIIASCTRVPVKDGHLATVTFKTNTPAEVEDIKTLFRKFRGEIALKHPDLQLPTAPKKPIILMEEENRPQPLLDVWAGEPERARGMAVSVGRIKKVGEYIRLIVLVHNTIRGAAGDSVLNAELALKLGYIE